MTLKMRSYAYLPAIAAVAMFVSGGRAGADDVIADDAIVQGSLCVGFDCVNNESFGFDTIRMKENNTRIKFDDTSTSAGFPNHDWQLTANDSASGGANKFSIEDITASSVPFTILGSAPNNSIFVDSTGRVGFHTATPVLDLHVNTSNTPAMRLEQNNSGGWTAQTWDIGANEANFFVRDVTGGSRLPLRIRPGAPTSSIDIAANGNVGIGTSSAGAKLHAFSTSTTDVFAAFGPSASGSGADGLNLGYSGTSFGTGSSFINAHSASANGSLRLMVDGAVRTIINNVGNVGIGTATPTAQLHTTGSVRFAGVANCGSGIQTDASGNLSCIVSSQRFKNIAGPLSYEVALANVMALRPEYGAYKKTPDVPEHWLIAEDVAAVDPALAGFADGKPYTVKTQNVVADLVAVVQYQQRQIEDLKRALMDKSKN